MRKPRITFFVRVEARPGAPIEERDRFEAISDLVRRVRLRLLGASMISAAIRSETPWGREKSSK